MSSKVEVLCPNGRRVVVKTNPNTKILQVLEEACKKQGFHPPEEYELRRGRQALDVTLSIRYAGLPNLAKLDLAKAAHTRAESSVLIAVQMEGGERLQGDFQPATTLWQLLEHWQTQPDRSPDTPILVSGEPGVHAVCVYMREEVIGEYALRARTLRDLGLTGGRAVIRLLHRAVDEDSLREIKLRLDSERDRQAKLAAKLAAATQPTAMETQSSTATEDQTVPVEAAMETNSDNDDTADKAPVLAETRSGGGEDEVADSNAQMDTGGSTQSDLSPPKRSLQEQSSDTSMAVCPATAGEARGRQHGAIPKGRGGGRRDPQGPDHPDPNPAGLQQISLPADDMQLTPEQEQIAQRLAEALMPGVFPQPNREELNELLQQRRALAQQAAPRARPPRQVQISYEGFKFPEETKGKDLYRNEFSDVKKEEYKPCERETVLFSVADRATPGDSSEELPEDFFEVRESDVKKLYVDLQKQVQLMDHQPLMTQSMKKLHAEQQLSRYQRVILRVHFPDELVLQGLFRPRETVFSLYKFVREHLEDQNMKFYLYTTPPRVIRRDMSETMIEANLAPMSLVYFGSEIKQDHYMSMDVMAETSTQTAADDIVAKHMSRSSQPELESAACSAEGPGTPGHHDHKRTSQLAASGAGASSSSSSSSSSSTPSAAASAESKAPKWFKMGK